MGMTRLRNILTGSHKFTPIKREIGFAERLGAFQVAERAAMQSRRMPTLPPTPRVNVPEVSGVRAKGALGGGSGYPMSNNKAR
ncbi:hypothetical protein WOJTEK_89 [Gordonia phage Wojtek]|uniref:Uncharacterized protein n=1 Tax=Gordonia phage Wojtek TaxID=2910758 RepID=A0AA49BNM0_9CAUD|nr:hypothetical protein WOJTEK_89 [Gordonia phage Wojtek]WPH58044.1 hypothetical protein SEA_LUCKYLEO_96 [Gordonia phage LuckyLeo]